MESLCSSKNTNKSKKKGKDRVVEDATTEIN